MGSPEDEVGRHTGEEQHHVTLTMDYYIGVFVVSQRQCELITGNNPSYFSNADYYATRPMGQVSYDKIRGSSAGAGWSTNNDVDSNSFLGKLRSKTGLDFDLPTEAQWECACRAGTTTALNTGKNLTDDEEDTSLDEAGRYRYNGGGDYDDYENEEDRSHNNAPDTAGTAKVGSYLHNAWGLYDVHGNVWERCLDWYGFYSGDAVAPSGASFGSDRVMRGGGWFNEAGDCRSARRPTSPRPAPTATLGSASSMC